MKAIYLLAVATLITVVLFSWGSVINDIEETYVDTGISEATPMDESFMETYDRQQETNDSYSSLEDDLINLGSDASWFDKLQSGLAIMFKGFIALPGKILTTTANLVTDGTTILKMIGIPIFLIKSGVTLFIAMVIFFLIELIRR